LSEDTVHLRKKLAQLEENGICWVAIHNLKELDGILWRSKSKKVDVKGPYGFGISENRRYMGLFSAVRNPLHFITSGILCFLGLMAVIFIVKYFFWQEPDMAQQAGRDIPQKTVNENSENINLPEVNLSPQPMPEDTKSDIKMGSEHMKMDDF